MLNTLRLCSGEVSPFLFLPCVSCTPCITGEGRLTTSGLTFGLRVGFTCSRGCVGSLVKRLRLPLLHQHFVRLVTDRSGLPLDLLTPVINFPGLIVVAKGKGPWRFWWINFLSKELLVFVGSCRLFFSWGFPQGCWQSFLSFLSLAFSPRENTRFLIFEIWILDVVFL